MSNEDETVEVIGEGANAADVKKVKKDRLKEKLREKREQDDISFVISDIRGRRFILKYLGVAGFYRNDFYDNPEMRTFRDGQKNLASRMLMDVLAIDKEFYGKALLEFNKEDEI